MFWLKNVLIKVQNRNRNILIIKKELFQLDWMAIENWTNNRTKKTNIGAKNWRKQACKTTRASSRSKMDQRQTRNKTEIASSIQSCTKDLISDIHVARREKKVEAHFWWVAKVVIRFEHEFFIVINWKGIKWLQSKMTRRKLCYYEAAHWNNQVKSFRRTVPSS